MALPRHRVSATVRSRSLASLLLLLVLLAYLAPRLYALDRLVTVDEGYWLGRSANFYEALVSGDLANTYQFAHPGVPTMWAGAIAYRIAFPDYATEYPRQINYVLDIHTTLRDLGRDPLTLLVAGRMVKLLIQALCLALGFWLARPVFGTVTATVGTLMLAFDPFLIGHDRLLHVDGMFATTAFVSLMALLRAKTRSPVGSAPFLALSGVFAALAWLTRTPGVVLIVIVAAVALATGWHHWRERGSAMDGARVTARLGLIWGGVATTTTFVAWPALWVSPIEVAKRMASWSANAASDGHEFTYFFNGTVGYGNPSVWYYPVSLIWRLTPLTLIGLAIVLAGVLVRSRAVLPRSVIAPLLVLAGYVLVYVVGMSLGAKKFDRYVLPVYPALDVIAAVGIVGLARLVARRPTVPRRALAGAFVSAVVLGQLFSALSTAPYYLPYFNPLLGGVAGAERALLLGWGEGMDQVAGFILSQPDGEQATIRASNQRNTLLYHLPPSATVSPRGFPEGMAGILVWAETDYYVAYVSQWQRGSSLPSAYLAAYPPVHTVTFDESSFARVYDLRTIPPPPWMITNSCAFSFRDDVQLVAYEDVAVGLAGINVRTLNLYFASLPGAAERYIVRVDLLPHDPDLEPLSREAVLQPAASGLLSEVDFDFGFPRKRTLRSYMLLVTVFDPATGEPIPATRLDDGQDRPRALVPGCTQTLP